MSIKEKITQELDKQEKMIKQICTDNEAFLNPAPTMSEEAFRARLAELKDIKYDVIPITDAQVKLVNEIDSLREVLNTEKDTVKRESIQKELAKREEMWAAQIPAPDVQERQNKALHKALDEMAVLPWGRRILEQLPEGLTIGCQALSGVGGCFSHSANRFLVNALTRFDKEGNLRGFGTENARLEEVQLTSLCFHELRHATQGKEGLWYIDSDTKPEDAMVIGLLSEAETALRDHMFLNEIAKNIPEDKLPNDWKEGLYVYRECEKKAMEEAKGMTLSSDQEKALVEWRTRENYVKALFSGEEASWLRTYLRQSRRNYNHGLENEGEKSASNKPSLSAEEILHRYAKDMGVSPELIDSEELLKMARVEVVKDEKGRMTAKRAPAEKLNKQQEFQRDRFIARAEQQGPQPKPPFFKELATQIIESVYLDKELLKGVQLDENMASEFLKLLSENAYATPANQQMSAGQVLTEWNKDGLLTKYCEQNEVANYGPGEEVEQAVINIAHCKEKMEKDLQEVLGTKKCPAVEMMKQKLAKQRE